tara:strand:- start:439 stop:780 length:342 start_codon:yes stop_codon:yes gene_type:complete
MLVFGAQVLASASFACHSETSSPESAEQAMDSHMMDHSQHLTLDSSADGVTSLDCCPDCDCSLGGCSNSVVLVATQNLFSFDMVLPTSRDNESVDDKLTLSLFRPPGVPANIG